MQGNRGGRNPLFNFGDPFAGFPGLSSFGDHRNLMSSFFGGRGPFDDPFFRDPFGNMFQSSFFGPSGASLMNGHESSFLEHQAPQSSRYRGPVIEELNSDEEKEEEKNNMYDNPRKHGRSNNEPYVEEPDDGSEGRRYRQLLNRTEFNRVNNPQPQPQVRNFTFQSSSVTYGGANGAYYTSSKSRRTGSDGLTIEENKEADSASGQASHRISRGIHDKGHSFSRKLNSDGRIDTMQTLHNLNEDEVPSFEEAWKSNARRHLPGWTDGLNVHAAIRADSDAFNGPASRSGLALPSLENTTHQVKMKSDFGYVVGPSWSHHRGGIQADSGARTGSNRGKSNVADPSNMDQIRRR